MFRLISATDEGDKDQQQDVTQCETTDAAVGEAYNLSVGSTDVSKCQEMKKTPEKSKSTALHDVEAASLHKSSTRESHEQKQKEDIETPSEDVCAFYKMRLSSDNAHIP